MDANYIYLDYNATCPLDQRVEDAMQPYYRNYYANPHSAHLFGLSLGELLDEATATICSMLGAKEERLIYTSGATEAINLAIQGLIPTTKKHFIALATEHQAVLATYAFLETLGYEVSYLPVQADGLLDLDVLTAAIRPDTALVCAMLANNETGVIQPIKAIAERCHAQGTLLLCDLTQAIGKISVNFEELEADFVAFSAHKFYGPKGIGALYANAAARKLLRPQIYGGSQQGGMRSGTLNVPAIMGMEAALTFSLEELDIESLRISALRDELQAALLQIPGSFVNGSQQQRIGNTLNICFPGISSERLILALGPICVSSGSACSATVSKPSHVLIAMGLSTADSLSAIRFSLGKYTRAEDIQQTIVAVKDAVQRLR